jgi:hypothetical protein
MACYNGVAARGSKPVRPAKLVRQGRHDRRRLHLAKPRIASRAFSVQLAEQSELQTLPRLSSGEIKMQLKASFGTDVTFGGARSRFALALVITAVSLIVLSSCREDDGTTVTRPFASSSKPNRSVGAKPKSIRSLEAEFAELSETAPSAAGFYIDDASNLVIQIRDSADDGAASAKVQEFLARGVIRRGLHFRGAVRKHRADYTFYQLATWRDSIFDNLLTSNRDITGLDMDERANRVSVGVRPAAIATVQATLSQMLNRWGADSRAVVIVPQNQIPAAAAAPRVTTRSLGDNSILGSADTLVGGVYQSVGNPVTSVSTLGLIVDYGTQGRSLLTCSHCSRVPFSLDSDTITQTARGTAGGWRSVSVETNDPGTFGCGAFNQSQCRKSDASMHRVLSGIYSHRGLIARTTNNSGSKAWDTSKPYFIVNGTATIYSGMSIQKIGETTGWRSGSVTNTCYDVALTGGPIIKCEVQTNGTSEQGDSGGPVFWWDGASSEVLFAGLNSAGTTSAGFPHYFTPMAQITQDLSATMTIVRGINLSTPSVGGSINGSANPVISWSAISGASRYEVYRAWCLNDGYGFCTFGTNGAYEYVTEVVGTSYTDTGMSASAYNGTTPPSSSAYGRVSYYVRAFSNTDLSNVSTVVYFTLQP